MSVINSSELHIWDNAAFDSGDSVDAAASIRNSWSTVSGFRSFDKENRNTTTTLRSPPSSTTPGPFHLNNFLGNANIAAKELGNCAVASHGHFPRNELSGFGRDGEQINAEIEDIQKEISRLSSRLLELKREKTERNAKTGERRGRVAFMELEQEQDNKQRSRNFDRLKKLEDSLLSSSSAGVMSRQRRGFSLGPAEIISAGAITRQMISKMVASSTPVNQKQDRRKSCFWKLDQIDELKMTKERGKSLSLSPRSKKAISKLPKQAATTVRSKKTMKKDESVTSSFQPKKLFKEGEKTSQVKKPVRAGRIVASRYNTSNNNQAAMNENTGLRKRSLPENEESKGNEKKRASLGLKSCSKEAAVQQQAHGRVKKKWEIPMEVVVYDSSIEVDDNQMKADALPETPRGAVKRAAELGDKKSVFYGDDEEEGKQVWLAEKNEY